MAETKEAGKGKGGKGGTATAPKGGSTPQGGGGKGKEKAPAGAVAMVPRSISRKPCRVPDGPPPGNGGTTRGRVAAPRGESPSSHGVAQVLARARQLTP